MPLVMPGVQVDIDTPIVTLLMRDRIPCNPLANSIRPDPENLCRLGHCVPLRRRRVLLRHAFIMPSSCPLSWVFYSYPRPSCSLEAILVRLEKREKSGERIVLGVHCRHPPGLNTRPLGLGAPSPALHKAIYRGEGIPGDALILISLLRAHDDTPLRYRLQRTRMQLPPWAVVHGHLLPYPCLRYLLRHRSSLVRFAPPYYPTGATRPLETILAALGGRSMHDPASKLRRILLLGGSMNKGHEKGPRWETPPLPLDRC